MFATSFDRLLNYDTIGHCPLYCDDVFSNFSIITPFPLLNFLWVPPSEIMDESS